MTRTGTFAAGFLALTVTITLAGCGSDGGEEASCEELLTYISENVDEQMWTVRPEGSEKFTGVLEIMDKRCPIEREIATSLITKSVVDGPASD